MPNDGQGSPLRSEYIILALAAMTHNTPRTTSSMSSIVYTASIFGISIASAVGIYKTWIYCRRLQSQADTRSRVDDELRQALGSKEDEIVALQRRLLDARSEVIEKAEMLESLGQEMVRAKKELADLEALVEGYREGKEELSKELEALRIVNIAVQGDAAMYDTRSSPEDDFESSTDFREDDSSSSLRTDESSVEDVMNLIKILNSEIFDTAISMAELFKSEEVEEHEEQGEQVQRAYAQAVEVLGARMVDLLRQKERRRNPVLLQWAFQACMSAFADWMVSSWYFEDPQSEQVLTSIYEQLRETEEQAVAGRWRVLTRTYVQSVVKERPDLSEYFLDAFSCILVAIGFRGTQAHFQDIIKRHFQDRMSSIGMQSLILNKTIGQELLSSEVDPIYVAPGTPFDSSVMNEGLVSRTDDEMPEPSSDSENILCTIELGLLWALKEHGSNKWEERVLLRPRVLREAGLEAIGLV